MAPASITAVAKGVGSFFEWWDGAQVSGYTPIYATQDRSNNKIFWVLGVIALIAIALVLIYKK